MRWARTLVCSLTLLACGSGGEGDSPLPVETDSDAAPFDPVPPDPAEMSLQRLTAESARPVRAVFEDGRPVFVSFQIPPPGPSAPDRAFDFLEAHTELPLLGPALRGAGRLPALR